MPDDTRKHRTPPSTVSQRKPAASSAKKPGGASNWS